MFLRSFFLNFLPVLADLPPEPAAAFAISQSPLLCRLLQSGFFLAGNGALARTFAGTSIGVRALSAYGEAATMTIAAIRTDLDEAFDMKRDILAEVPFCRSTVLDRLTNMV